MEKLLFTSESVTEGHPDKMCDQISDAVVDAIMEQDPTGRVECETTVNTGYAMLMGEITTNCYIDIPKIAREVICDIGYDNAEYGFDGNTCAVMTSIDEQSSDIAMGVDKALEYKDGELMSEDEIAVMDGGKCILQLRGVRPFFSEKYDITKHPKYKYLSDFDKKNAFDMEKHLRRRPAIVKPDEVFDYYEVDEADLQEDTENE